MASSTRYRLVDLSRWVVVLLISLSLISSHVALAQDEQRPLEEEVYPAAPPKPKRIAVIGAGSAGSSTAYYLRKYAEQFSVPVDITVLEKSSYVGGRSTTVDVFNDPSFPVELGASIFVSVNKNLMKASKEFGLKTKLSGHNQPKESDYSVGIWDGDKFVFRQKENGYRWWNILKILLQYGWSPMRTQQLMKTTVDTFLKLYEAPYFPWKSLSSVAMNTGLTEATWATGAEFLKGNRISEKFSREIIQASTRVNYGQNLPLIHGLETMVCMATDGAVSIEGGNWQIFRHMIDASKATLRLNSTVTRISAGRDHSYIVSYKRDRNATREEEFDQVVIANPFQFSDIKLIPSLTNVPDNIPYVELHVTLFASPHKLSPKYFKLSEQSDIPEVVLTTLPEKLDLGSRRDGVGPSDFWSISTLRKARPPLDSHARKIQDMHYVYKVFSPKPLTADFLIDMLGIGRSGIISPREKSQTAPAADKGIKDISKSDISWHHEKVWHSYPYLYPRVTFEDIKLAPNLWYTGGIESFISTMETSSLSGMNVAALITSEWVKDFESKLKASQDAGVDK